MFSRLKKWFNEREKTANLANTALNVFMNPGFNTARATLEHLLFENRTISQAFSLEKRKELQKDIIERVLSTYQAESPLLKNRLLLIESVIDMATYGVLILNCEDDPNNYCSHPAISGELRFYLDDIAKKDETIKTALSIFEPEERDLKAIFYLKYLLAHVLAEVHRALRIDFEGQIEPKMDWYHPFVIAMYICKEDEFREIIGLPSLAENYFGKLGRLQNGVFINILLTEEKDPLSEFNKMFNST